MSRAPYMEDLIKHLNNAGDVLHDILHGRYTDENIEMAHLETVMHIIGDTEETLRNLQAEACASAEDLKKIMREAANLPSTASGLSTLKALDKARALEEEVLANTLLDFLEML